MSRLNRFAASLISGYLLLGVNVLYTLISIPLALHYLSKAEFALWALGAKIGVFLTMVDFGLSAAVARILIDHKDDREKGGYGAMVKTGFLVGASQGALILLCGTALAWCIGPLLHVDAPLQPTLRWLMLGQYALLATACATRTFSHVLAAHQRFDINNYGQSLALIVTLGVTWVCFAHGQGVFSILWGYAATVLQTTLINWGGCARLRLLPRAGEWGRITWAHFKSVFSFGNDIFLYSLGSLLITASQTILLTRLLGLETVTVWNVFTRVYDVLQQVIFRIFDYSSSALAEMIVRGEKARLAARFQQIVTLSTSFSVAAGVLFAVCNSSFVSVWTSGRFESAQLTAADIKEPLQLAEQLRGQETPAVRSLWEQLTPEAHTVIQAASAPVSDALAETLARELNQVMRGAPLGSAQGSPAPARAGTTAGNQQAQVWANRHVLEDVFPGFIADSRKAHWSFWNDVLLAVWLIICVSLHAHTGLVGQAKALRFLRYIFFCEGLAFVGLTCWLYRFGGITAMLGVSIGCSLAFSFAYGLYRTRRYFELKPGELAAWHRAPLRLALWLVPVAILVAWLTHSLSPWARLSVNASVIGLWSLFVLLRHGLEPTLQAELLNRAPAWARAWLSKLLPGTAAPHSQ